MSSRWQPRGTGRDRLRRRALVRTWAAGVAVPVLVIAAASLPPRDPWILEPSWGGSAAADRAEAASQLPPPVTVRQPPVSQQSPLSPASGLSQAPALRPELTLAYANAVALMPPTCGLRTQVLAAMGHVGSASLEGRALDENHRALPPVYGAAGLSAGSGRSADTDDGSLDAKAAYDRPVGPLAFLVPTWQVAGADGDGDGLRDPQDIEDAAVSAAYFLCLGGRDLGEERGLRTALLSYHHSTAYADLVLRWTHEFDLADGQTQMVSQLLAAVGPSAPATRVPGDLDVSAAGRSLGGSPVAGRQRLAATSPATGTSPTTGATPTPGASPGVSVSQGPRGGPAGATKGDASGGPTSGGQPSTSPSSSPAPGHPDSESTSPPAAESPSPASPDEPPARPGCTTSALVPTDPDSTDPTDPEPEPSAEPPASTDPSSDIPDPSPTGASEVPASGEPGAC